MRKGSKCTTPASTKQRIQREKFVFMGSLTGIRVRVEQLQRMKLVPEEWRMVLTPVHTALTHVLLKLRKEGLNA